MASKHWGKEVLRETYKESGRGFNAGNGSATHCSCEGRCGGCKRKGTHGEGEKRNIPRELDCHFIVGLYSILHPWSFRRPWNGTVVGENAIKCLSGNVGCYSRCNF